MQNVIVSYFKERILGNLQNHHLRTAGNVIVLGSVIRIYYLKFNFSETALIVTVNSPYLFPVTTT